MDPLSELELMAANIEEFNDPNTDLAEADLRRWKDLFDMDPNQAENCIREHRANLTRYRISDDHWDMIRSEMTSQGHDKESFEFSLRQYRQRKPAVPDKSPENAEYLLKLEAPLDCATKAREAAGLDHDPSELPAVNDSNETESFVIVDGRAKDAILQRYNHGVYQPTFVRLSKARKDLCAYSAYPKLSEDTSLPQFRLHSADASIGVLQNEYPVWYFFYGTLAEPDRLGRLLQAREDPNLVGAYLPRGKIKTWAGKYKALVNGEERVEGSAFLVKSREQEEALQYYETDNYEVVRCQIRIGGRAVDGLTFRFVDERQLT